MGVSRNGRVRFVMVPVDEYERLRRRERIAGRVEDLDNDTLEAIRGRRAPRPSATTPKSGLVLPKPGEVINYSYLWEHEYRAGRDEGLKDRPSPS